MNLSKVEAEPLSLRVQDSCEWRAEGEQQLKVIELEYCTSKPLNPPLRQMRVTIHEKHNINNSDPPSLLPDA
ncbi:hypothetical protein E2C01_039239 [Portunus trituberculatus]|uniref:Uncharacterized protein n=1 Tax=Portunus trituberculatus TaxID=210409 RepID=A0A5B7FKU7_PORTR|nr:hypothetical protein [Portunus trituberculatus]